jgi:cytochrome c
VIPLVSVAFLLAYLHKYSWDRLADRKALHRAIGAAATLLFLLIPFIFLANINLMLFPARWTEIRGFLSAVMLDNVLPRYGHFLLGSIALSNLFLLGWFTRSGYPLDHNLPEFDRAGLRRFFYYVIFGATFGQLFMGPLVYFTLPAIGVDLRLIIVIAIGVSFALAALLLLWRETLATPARIGKRYVTVATLLTWTVCCMAYGRHVYRDNALADHQQLMAARTNDATITAEAAGLRAAAGVTRRVWAPGEEIFTNTCASCHALDQVLVGPPITEVADLYAGNPEGIVAWTLNPGRKRAGFPQMPAFRLPEQKLAEVARYMLNQAAPSEGQ